MLNGESVEDSNRCPVLNLGQGFQDIQLGPINDNMSDMKERIVAKRMDSVKALKALKLLNKRENAYEFKEFLLHDISESRERLQLSKDMLDLDYRTLSHAKKCKTTQINYFIKKNLNLKGELKKLQLEKYAQECEISTLLSILKEKVEAITLAEEDAVSLRSRKTLLQQGMIEKQEEAKNIDLAHCTAIGYFKSRLQCRIDLMDDQETSFCITFFRTDKDIELKNYFIHLRYNGTWKMLAMQPALPCQKELCARLEETGDIQGFIVHVRKLFLQYILRHKVDS